MTQPKGGVLDLNQHYQTGEQIAEGRWETLECGLPVRVARANSPEFYRVGSAKRRKYGGRGNREMKPKAALRATIETLAEAVFLEFRGEVLINGERHKDSTASRILILQTYPDIRDEIANLASVGDMDFIEEVEDSGKD